jgi:hypothetical protein
VSRAPGGFRTGPRRNEVNAARNVDQARQAEVPGVRPRLERGRKAGAARRRRRDLRPARTRRAEDAVALTSPRGDAGAWLRLRSHVCCRRAEECPRASATGRRSRRRTSHQRPLRDERSARLRATDGEVQELRHHRAVWASISSTSAACCAEGLWGERFTAANQSRARLRDSASRLSRRARRRYPHAVAPDCGAFRLPRPPPSEARSRQRSREMLRHERPPASAVRRIGRDGWNQAGNTGHAGGKVRSPHCSALTRSGPSRSGCTSSPARAMTRASLLRAMVALRT